MKNKFWDWGRRGFVAGSYLLVSQVMTYAQGDPQMADDLKQQYDSLPAYTQVFKENIQAAVANHPQTSAAIAERDSYRYRQREAEAGLYPTLEVGVSGRYRMADSFEDRFDNITERSRRDTSAHASLTGRQLLYDGGQTSSRVASAKHAFTAAHEQYGQMASAIALRAIEVHFQTVYQRMRLLQHQENIADHRQMLEKVRLRFESGRGPRRDVSLLEARLALAEAAASNVRRDLDYAINQYEEIYGFPPENLKRPDIALQIPETQEGALEMGFQNNPSLSIANSQMMASKEGMEAEKADRLPHLSMELAATKYDIDRGNSDYDVTGRLVMNYSLYNGGARSARISRSLKDYDRARHDEATIQREVTRKIKVAYQNMKSHDDRVLALQKATNASKRNSQQLMEQFEATGGSLLSLLEAKKEYYQSREQYMEALIEKDILRFRLLDVMGTLTPALNIRLKKAGE